MIGRPGFRVANGGRMVPASPGYYSMAGYYQPFDEPYVAVDTLISREAAPWLGGQKFKGWNIVPRPTDDGNGPAVSPSVMYEFIYRFLTEGSSGPTWQTWIKPQIDGAKALGANCVRLYWDVSTLVGDASHMVPARTINVGTPQQAIIQAVTYLGPVSWAQLATGIQTICNYLAAQGMYFYPTATECQPVDYVTEAGLLDYIDHFIAEIKKYPNVIAVDVVMETDRCLYTQTAANIAKIMEHAKAARGTTTLPLTCSISTLVVNDAGWKDHVNRVIAAGVEFIDAHVYIEQSWTTLMDYLFNHESGLPVAMGEGGLTYSGAFFSDPGAVAQETTHPKSSELRARHYQDVIAAFGRRSDLQLFTPYGVVGQWPQDVQDWGVYDDLRVQISGVATGNPAIVTTVSAHGRSSGESVMIGGTTCTPTIDGKRLITVLSPTTFSVPVNVTGAGGASGRVAPSVIATPLSSARTEMTGPYGTIPRAFPFTSDPWTLDLSGGDTTPESLTTFAVGWGQFDTSATFSRAGHKLKRVTSGAVTVGLLNEYLPLSRDQRLVVEFNAADGVAVGGTINWSVALRVQPGGTDFYLITLTSSPGAPATDGLVTVYRMPDAALLGSFTLSTPAINLVHRYRLTATAIGTYPTALVVTVEDLTAVTTAGSVSISDSSPRLQGESVTSLPSQTGTVLFSLLTVECRGRRGPTLDSPIIVSNITGTTVDLTWPAAVGGIGPYRYIPQYLALDTNQLPVGHDWTVVGAPGGQVGTTVTITGLTPDTSYVFRVQIIDDALSAAA